MKNMKKGIQFITVLLMLLGMVTTATAALKAVGPVDSLTTLPTYYQDTNNLALQPCLDQNNFCLLPPPFDPLFPPVSAIATTPPINDANFPGESFYYSAQAIMPIEGGELANLAFVLEAAFLSGVTPDGGITFLRTDLQKMRNLAINSTYRVTHPYGSFEFSTDAAGDTTGGGGVAVRLEDGPAVPADWFPLGFKVATNTGIGPYLIPKIGGFITDPVSGHVYIGNGTPIQVTGSPTGNNFFRIQRLTGPGGNPVPGASWETDLFALNGRVFTGPILSDLTFKATYARSAVDGQIDIFATALPGAVLTLSGNGITTTPLTTANPANGEQFLHIPLATSTLPTGLLLANSLDLQAAPARPVSLVDEVIVSQAIYNPITRDLIIKADSRDNLAPLPTLTAPQFTAPNTLDATGTLIKTIAVDTIPPREVSVTSSRGGIGSIPISVMDVVALPLAANDTASTTKGGAVTINVIANDASAGSTIDPNSVTIVATPASGATAVPVAGGSVQYTPPADFTGSETFDYTVKDALGQVSNVATVTVTVNAPPVAANDSASAVVGTTVGINVIANDTASNSTINSASVNIVSPASCGSLAVQANGTVNFTAPAAIPSAPGTCSFSYVVSDTFVPSSVSNVATVTVAILSTPPPVAVNDSATTTTSSTVVINVIANDTSSTSTINPASIVVAAPSGGTAVANANGTVSYTAPAAPGTYTFAYTVKDNNIPALTSNATTVTVTVNAPFLLPTAVNNSAVVAGGSSIVINVAANDVVGTNPLNLSSVAVAAAPAHGTAIANADGAGTITYTPTAGFSGADSFTYNIQDTAGNVSNNATVSVTVTTPAPTETITATRVQFILSSASWRVDGTTNAPIAGQTMKIFNRATVPADGVTGLLATVNVGANGSFTWTSANGAPAPNAQRRISFLSSKNPNFNKLEQVTVTVR